MDRRRWLSAVGGLGIGVLVGCTASRDSISISDPVEEREDDGETHLRFRHDRTNVATVTVQPGHRRYAGVAQGQSEVDVSIQHRDGTEVTALELGLRPVAPGGSPPGQVALTTPFGTPHPSLQYYRDPDDGAATVAIPDTGGVGTGTITFEFLVYALDPSVTELGVDVTIELATGRMLGERYTLSAFTTLPLPETEA